MRTFLILFSVVYLCYAAPPMSIDSAEADKIPVINKYSDNFNIIRSDLLNEKFISIDAYGSSIYVNDFLNAEPVLDIDEPIPETIPSSYLSKTIGESSSEEKVTSAPSAPAARTTASPYFTTGADSQSFTTMKAATPGPTEAATMANPPRTRSPRGTTVK